MFAVFSSLTDVHILYVDPNGDNVRLINKSPVVSSFKSYTVGLRFMVQLAAAIEQGPLKLGEMTHYAFCVIGNVGKVERCCHARGAF